MDSDSEPKLRSLISQLQSPDNTDSENISLLIQMMSLVSAMDLDSQPKPKSEFMSLVTQAISFFSSIDLDSLPNPLSDLVSLISEKISLHKSIDSYSEPKLRSLISQLIVLDSTRDSDSELISHISQIISLVRSMDLDSQPKPESRLMSLVTRAISLFSSMDLDSQPKPLSKLISIFSQKAHINSTEPEPEPDAQFTYLIVEIRRLEPLPELIFLVDQIIFLFTSPDSDFDDWLYRRQLRNERRSMKPDPDPEPESKLKSLITKLLSVDISWSLEQSNGISLIIHIISMVKSMDFDSQPKPESKLMSLVTQTVSFFNSMDLDSQPKPLSGLISLISQNISLVNSPDFELYYSLVTETMRLNPEPELISLILQIFSLVISLNSKWNKLISICPQVEVRLEQGKSFEEIPLRSGNKWACLYGKWECLYGKWKKLCSTGKGNDPTHFFCGGCNGRNHEEYEKAPSEIKHHLHTKHSLQLAFLEQNDTEKICYCCDEQLDEIIYYCSACDFAIAFTCVEKPPVLSIDHPKWHEHTLALFPTRTSLTCDLCALSDSSCPFYICPPCDFVVHQSCINLPRVIRISRHLHRISFTPSFNQGDWYCGVCRRKVDNDYGGFSCIKEGCSYAAHSKCATQRNVWDGVDLEGEPEEIEEEVLEPFVRISDGIIQHFSHQHHHLILDEDTSRDYDENKLCQACITPIYFGNFYSCMQCDFILHEECANLSRKIHHPIHPHLLTLVTENSDVIDAIANISCSACPWLCTGFFYECDDKWCEFKVHVQCATISEPLVHESHMHPLFLTSKPGERRTCGVCNGSRRSSANTRRSSADETFNCIDCDFALCFGCATVPQKVRYRHDKHMLTLSYGEETSTTTYWCEICERKVNPQKRFYRCDEYCCITLHIECLVEEDLYMKPGLSLRYLSNCIVNVTPNNHLMSRPFCEGWKDGKRCSYRFVFMFRMSAYCSISCFKSKNWMYSL